jgi:hypothetical protein
MALIRLNPEKPSDAGWAATYNAGLTTTDTFLVRNSGLVLLHVKKSGANACTVSITPQKPYRGKTIPAQTVSIPATNGDKFIGILPPDLYNDVNGDAYITFSEVTGLTMAVLDLATP